MADKSQKAERIATARNITGAVAALLGACVVVAQVTEAPSALTIALAIATALSLAAALVLYLIERRLEPHDHKRSDSARRIPRLVPAGPMKFVNRVDELAHLDTILERTQTATGPTIAVLGGMPGAGKSAVGMHWASATRTRFSDGDLFADFSERRRGNKVDVSGVLADFIRMLGSADTLIPAQLPERVDLYRTLTYGRKLLIVLDDVTEAGQVKQLQPAGGGSLVLATSYRHLDELHYDGAEYVPVNPLTDDRAERLLTEMAGEQGWRFAQAPEETSEILGFCGGLALPLCVCASRLLLNQGALSVAAVAASIRNESSRLAELSGKGEYSGAAVFGFAYADLTVDRQLVYRRLGLHPGIELRAAHAALLADLSLSDAQQHLDALVDTHLVEIVEDGHYRFHGLVRLHARETAERTDDESRCEHMLRRLVDWYFVALRNSDRTIVPDRLRIGNGEAPPVKDAPQFDSREDAFAWLEDERANILAVLQLARDREWDERAWEMAEALWLYYHNRRHYFDWIDATQIGIECARRLANTDAEARLRTQLAVAFIDLGHFDRARSELTQAEQLVTSSANTRLRGSVREFNAVCYLNERDYTKALDAFRQSRDMFASIDGRRGVAIQDYNIGRVLIDTGEYQEAITSLETALSTMRAIDDKLYIGRILLRLGQAAAHETELEKAERTLHEAISVLAPLGMRLEEAESYDELAAIAETSNRAAIAAERRERAQNIYRAIGHPKADGSTPSRPSSLGLAAAE
jgi:tetratricopeptide (TPR) repeat protein